LRYKQDSIIYLSVGMAACFTIKSWKLPKLLVAGSRKTGKLDFQDAYVNSPDYDPLATGRVRSMK